MISIFVCNIKTEKLFIRFQKDYIRKLFYLIDIVYYFFKIVRQNTRAVASVKYSFFKRRTIK